MRTNAYLIGYSDPDEDEAEHLLQAAWHLERVGRLEEADRLAGCLAKLFEAVPVDRKLGYKVLGKVAYVPAGYATMSVHGSTFSVPTPPYDVPRDGTAQDAAAVRNAKTCRQACRWFPERQVAAAVSGKPIRSTFRPAKDLAAIIKLCNASSEDLSPTAASILRNKLRRILDKNPMSWKKDTRIRQDLDACHAYSWQRAEPLATVFAWMGKDAVETAAKLVRDDVPDLDRQIRSLPVHRALWYECRTPFGLCDAVQAIPPENPGRYPILYASSETAREHADGRGCPMTQPETRAVADVAWEALYAAAEAENLARLHAALLSVDDDYLQENLAAAGVTDPELDVPGDLWRRTAMLIVPALFSEHGPGPGPAKEGAMLIREILANPATVALFEERRPVAADVK